MIAETHTIAKSKVLTQLQRKRNVVEQLQKKLDSYLFTPKTPSLFEKKEDLKTGLHKFNNGIEVLLAELKMQDVKVMNYISDVERQFEEFNLLHQKIEEYTKVVQH